MTQYNLSRLQQVEPRTVWTSESGDFTPWLAQMENLALLGETLNLELELEATEEWVGPFRADIVCRDTLNDSYVLVENQLERTDHNHLGQLLTYAAGLNAVSIVWIADRFTEEHRAALDWLNEITGEDINFFGLEIELWRIGDSPIAPKFNVVSKPNDWAKSVKKDRRQATGELTETQQFRLEYWQAFVAYLKDQGTFLKTRTPKWYTELPIPVGRTGFRLEALIYAVYGENLAIQIVISGKQAETHYRLLQQQRAEIEEKLGETLDWQDRPDASRSRIVLRNEGYDPNNRSQWPQQHAWFKEKLEAFYNTFSPRIKELDADEYEPEMIHTFQS